MTHPSEAGRKQIFKDVELTEDSPHAANNKTKKTSFKSRVNKANKVKDNTKPNKSKPGLQYSFNLANIPLFEKINLIKSISREIFLGLAIPKILDMYYNFENLENSPILNTTGKNKAYLERYFLLLITAVGFNEEEFLYWLSFIKDSNGQGLDSHVAATEPSSFPEALQYIKAVASLFASVMLEKVATSKVIDPY